MSNPVRVYPPVPRPAAGEYAPFYAPYIAAAEGVDLPGLLEAQCRLLERTLRDMEPGRALHRYAEGKWSVKEVLGHLSDAERVFSYRLLRVGRGDATPMPGFDENHYVAAARFDARSVDSLLDEFLHLRRSTLELIAGMGDDAWPRIGVANGHPVSARALAWIMAGHVAHHLEVLAERYGVTPAS